MVQTFEASRICRSREMKVFVAGNIPPDGELEPEKDPSLHLATVERLVRLLGLLSANVCTRHEVFDRLAEGYHIDLFDNNADSTDAANRMFERDINFLQDIGFTIKKKHGGRHPMRYSLVKGSGPYIPLLFSDQDVDILAMFSTMFTDPTRYARLDPQQPLPTLPHPPFAHEISRCIQRLVDTLSPKQQQRFERWAKKPFIYFNSMPTIDYQPHRETIEALVQAITDRQQVRFLYLAAQRAEPILHKPIDPYYITQLEGHFYLIAYNHTMNRFYEYRLDRIQHGTVKKLEGMIDVERRRHPVEFRFWLDGSLAKSSLSQRWLSQVIEREEAYVDEKGRTQRRVLVHATAYNEWRVIQQMLRYGNKVEVIEPLTLREQMRQEIARMAQLYEKT